MLKIALPKGSLEEGTLRLFEKANLPAYRRSERDLILRIEDPRISTTMMLRPQEIPKYVEEGDFDLGITGWDWVVEREAVVEVIQDLGYSKRGWRKVKIVLATNQDNPVNEVKDIKSNARITTEYPRLTRQFFRKSDKGKVSIRLSYGATEAKVPALADYFVDVAETGETLRRNRNKVLATILESSTKLIANKESWRDNEKRTAINEISILLMSVIRAENKTLIKMNVFEQDVARIVAALPSLRSPTVSPLFPTGLNISAGEKWFMIETVADKSSLNILLPQLSALGARDILELDISKMVSVENGETGTPVVK